MIPYTIADQDITNEIYTSLVEQYPERTTAFSPYSLTIFLSHVIYQHKTYQYLSTEGPIRVANALIAPDLAILKPDFLDMSREYYGAEIFQVKKGIVQAVNAWAERHTDGLITKFLDSVPNDLAFVALNALVFHGKWKQAFDKGKTRNRPFYLSSGEAKNIPMLSDQRTIALHRTSDGIFIELPFAEEGYSYCLYMPKGETDWGELAHLSPFDFSKKTRPCLVDLYLPKQDITFQAEYKNILDRHGVPVHGPFTSIAYGDIELDKVLQKVRILVHEEGVDAAAVTGGVFTTTALLKLPPTISIDHPYLYWIIDKPHNRILFQGCVRDFTPFQ